MSEQLLVNLRKAHAARLWWTNQWGMKAKSKPATPTVHGQVIDVHALAMRLPDELDETMLERAMKRGILDVWRPVCRVDFSSRVHEFFQGDRALKIYAAWAAEIFSKQKPKPHERKHKP